MLVDSHCHLNYLDAPLERLADARQAGISGVLCVGVEAERIHEVLALANGQNDVWATVGQHPDSSAADADWIEPLLSRPSVVAVGETGLDFHHARSDAARQRQLASFEYQLALAERHKLPVVVHTRNAESETLELLRAFPDVEGVLHCFTESWEMASQALDLGWYVSISGIVTFRNAEDVRTVAKRLPGDRLLVETDAPWLAPVPHRGQTNQPAWVRVTAAFLAELRETDLESLAMETTDNFRRLFLKAGSGDGTAAAGQ